MADTHKVVHAKLYLSVGGKLEHIPKGSTLELTDATAKGLGAKVEPIGKSKSVKLDTAKK